MKSSFEWRRRLVWPLTFSLGLAIAGCATESTQPAEDVDAAEVIRVQPLPRDFFDQNHIGDLEQGIKAYRNRDYTTALHEFYALANAGNAEAQFYLGLMFARGEGIPRDAEQARIWLRNAAAQGNRDAQFTYANLLWQGFYLPRDRQEALNWYLGAAGLEHPEAQFILGRLYATGGEELAPGETVEQDLSVGFQWMQRAANNGFAAAQHNLALMYQYGAGVTADLKEALAWFEQAARQGSPSTAYDFGQFYMIQSSPYYDPERALYWFKQAALAGHPDANRQVGALEKQVDLGRNSLVLFGAPLALQTRDDLRRTIRRQGGINLVEQSDSWFDSYDSKDVWNLSDRLFVGYVLETGRVAAIQYRLPGANTPKALADLRDLLEARYGKPGYTGERVYEDGIYNEWLIDDTRLVLSRGTGDSLFLSYYVKPAYDQMTQEQMRQRKAEVPVGRAFVRVY